MPTPRITLLACIAALGCSGSEEGVERYARRALPVDKEWRLESEIPAEPQQTPGMVIWEVSLFPPEAEPTSEHERAAAELVERCYEAAEKHRWFEYEKGLADGFALLPRDRRHYQNDAFVLDDHVLDPDRPEYLMYYDTPTGKQLVGFMFLMRDEGDRGPQVGGPLTIWHYHVWSRKRCVVGGVTAVAIVKRDEDCPEGVGSHRSTEMIHVWLIDRREGPFATSMFVPLETAVTGLAKRKRERGF